jgi:hypothetical protein
MTNYTLTYSPGVEGWPSFYSYYPEFMIGMNQFFYTFNGGNLYRHNVNENRNTFYGVFTPSTVRGIINQSPIEKKVFKTIALESNAAWAATLTTDLESGFIDKPYFEDKEATFFAFIRGVGGVNPNLSLRSSQGIGASTSVNASTPAATVVTFDFNIDSMISIDDLVYEFNTGFNELFFCGPVTGRTENTLTINCSSLTSTAPTSGQFLIYIKNQIAESHGLRGDYLDYTITNDDNFAVELFAIRSDVFKSFP